ncbi:unnamed protein product, partial [Discosporangium mesarthrocarpum]
MIIVQKSERRERGPSYLSSPVSPGGQVGRMAGTRLIAHASFLIFTVVTIYLALRLGAVKRASLPLRRIEDLELSPQAPPLPINVDLVLLRRRDDCEQCAALLQALELDPVLAQAAFHEDPEALSRRVRNGNDSNDVLGFTVGEVVVRTVHVGSSAGTAIGESLVPGLKTPVALDEWLRRFLVPPTGGEDAQYASPRYTFFVGCGGEENEGQLGFMMGKHRHGYLGLDCREELPCSTQGNDGDPAFSCSPSVPSQLQDAAATVVQGMAALVVAYVLRSPISLRDVHVRLGLAYRLSFTLLSEDPGLRRCTWDFAATSRRYLRPMLRKLAPFASFSVQSQELHYARLSSTPPHLDDTSGGLYLTPHDLRSFMGANDFSLLDLGGGSNSTSPLSEVAVNFMVFCPSGGGMEDIEDMERGYGGGTGGPLVFREKSGGPYTEAYEVPGFGGVSVMNRWQGASTGDGGGDRDGDVGGGYGSSALGREGADGGTGGTHVTDFLVPDRLRRSMGAHAAQLRGIIGLPGAGDRPSSVPWPLLPFPLAAGLSSSPSSFSSSSSSASSLSSTPGEALPLLFLPSPSDGVTDWELDALLWLGFLEHRKAARDTLRSVAEVAASRPEMEVGEKVAGDVWMALEQLVAADAALDLGTPTLRSKTPSPPTARGTRERVGAAGGVGVQVEAMRRAREAARRAELAYFDHTMVPQLYFPLSHLLVAVYLPFLGPLAVPLLWGFVQELRRYQRKRREGG